MHFLQNCWLVQVVWIKGASEWRDLLYIRRTSVPVVWYGTSRRGNCSRMGRTISVRRGKMRHRDQEQKHFRGSRLNFCCHSLALPTHGSRNWFHSLCFLTLKQDCALTRFVSMLPRNRKDKRPLKICSSLRNICFRKYKNKRVVAQC